MIEKQKAEVARPRYDTLVVKNADSATVPRQAAGGEVVAWSRGHDLAYSDVLREFAERVADGGDMWMGTELEDAAREALETAMRYRDYPEERP